MAISIKYHTVKNPRRTPHGILVNLSLEGLPEEVGEVEFLATATDSNPEVVHLFERIEAGEFGAVVEAPVPVPSVVHTWKFLETLIEKDLYDTLFTAVDALPVKKRKKVKNRLEKSPAIKRNNQELNALADSSGISQNQLDQLFIEAWRVE